MGAPIDVGGVEFWVERRGQGPDVLLIAGLSDPAEAWHRQLDGLADRYSVAAYDDRGTGRTPLPDGPLTVGGMADDAAAILDAFDVPGAHVAAFSGGGAPIAQYVHDGNGDVFAVATAPGHVFAVGLEAADARLLDLDEGLALLRTVTIDSPSTQATNDDGNAVTAGAAFVGVVGTFARNAGQHAFFARVAF